jgi:hypothetical protein
MGIEGWLRSLGLERYEAAFRENEIDDTILPRLTAEDLKELGVGPIGHHRKLLDAIAALRYRAATSQGGMLGKWEVGHDPTILDSTIWRGGGRWRIG